MVEITEIPTEELETDLRESLQDIQACEAGLACGLVESCGTPIQTRLEHNKYFVKVITAELKRRLTKHALDAGKCTCESPLFVERGNGRICVSCLLPAPVM